MQGTDLIRPVAIKLSPCPGPDHKSSGPRKRMMRRPLMEENIHGQRTLLAKCARLTTAADLNNTPAHLRRKSVGGKGMFLHQMQRAGLRVPEFQCVTTETVGAIEQHPLDTHRLSAFIPGIADELTQETTLADIKAHINALPAANQDKRTDWLAGLSQFIASHDFYELVKDTEAARQIRSLKMPLPPVIVRSSGINEDNYGDAQAGKYLSEVQGDEDVLRTCLKVMASGYRPDVCTTLQPMALIIQRCIDCRYGGVAMSYQSLQDDTIRVEYTPGQPRGAVAGLSGTRAHRINIEREADHPEFIPGQVSTRFILQKNGNMAGGYTEIETSKPVTDEEEQRLSDDSVAELRKAVTKMEDLLLCPVDVEFAIDHQGHLFLLQVRPITRLAGGMDFAMSTPKDTLATGEGVSEGYCTGTLWLGTNQAADTMPEGAIIVARHGEPWMLEPEYLGRAAGFVFAAGGSNDHVAITLRQAGKPCLLAAEQYPDVTTHHGQQATLACARFNGTPAAFIVAGDLSAQLTQHRTATSASEAVKLPEVPASRDDLLPATFDQVADRFRWLTEQNARLLAFFAPGGGVDCLASPIALSMSAQRSEIVAAARASINQLVQGTEALLTGYQAFLQPADNEPQVKSLLDELPQLTIRFEVLKQTITARLDRVISDLNTELSTSPGRFREWTAACQQLQTCLQELHPAETDQVRSVHDLIFALHSRFVGALAKVTLATGQGRLTVKRNITFIDCIPPGEEGLLRASGKASIEQILDKVTLINMVDALIVNLRLGNHIATIELLENAEGGKGRTLRLKFSDIFTRGGKSGKLKRMWFLVQLIKETGVNKYAGDMKVCINPTVGEMTVECSRMASRQTMQDACETLIALVCDLDDLDFRLEKTPIFEQDQWDFNKLAHHLDNDGSTQADRFAFNQCLFSIAYIYKEKELSCYKFLGKRYQQIFDLTRRLQNFTCSHQEMLIQMGDEISQDMRREIFHHLLLFDSNAATLLLEHEYNLQNKYFVLRPSHSYSLEFYIHPHQPLSGNHRTNIKSVVLEHGISLASRTLRNDKAAVFPRLKVRGRELRYAGEIPKCDKETVMAAVSNFGCSLCVASPELQDDDEVVMSAITQHPAALAYASERLRSDKNFIQIVIKDNFDYLHNASETVLNDREYMLSLIEHNARAYCSCGSKLKSDPSFRKAAIQCNPEVRRY